MDYLTKALGIKVLYRDHGATAFLPNYLYSRYDLEAASLDGIRVVFVRPKTGLDSVSDVKKHLERIKDAFDAFPVLIPERLTFRERAYLLRSRIPFVVDGKQIYLPFMATYLQQRCDIEKSSAEQFLPSAQVLLLHFIYNGCDELMTSDAARVLGFSPMSISRASRQLEETGILKSEKRGVGKALISDKEPEELFEEAQRLLMNPVKRTVYMQKNELGVKLPLSGHSALSEYSMLNPPRLESYAACSISKWKGVASGNLLDENDQCAVELWRYDPKKLSKDGCVDRLSLALALRNDTDERTEEAVEEMLHQLWREIDGKRN
ncbi:MAG: MarR family transcriptional regulator [Clostridiales bacterium]|nr:MarR family transcriptional regulator [Clostridiales bacterium]